MNTNTNIENTNSESNKREKLVENVKEKLPPIKKGPIMNPILSSFDKVLQEKMAGNNSYSFYREIDG